MILFLKVATCEKVERKEHTKFGLVALSAVLVSFLFTTVHWWKAEETIGDKLKTLPWLLLQFYPQYKAIRIIYLWLKDDQTWLSEKTNLEGEIIHVGKYNSFFVKSILFEIRYNYI